jgi:hypothetical protein
MISIKFQVLYMNKLMIGVDKLKIVSYVFLILFSILFLLFTLVGSIAWAVNATVLKPYHTTELLKQSGIYANLSEMLRSNFKNSFDSSDALNQLDPVKKVLINELDQIVTEPYIEQKLNLLHTQLWDYLSDQSPLNLQIDISEISLALEKVINDQITDPNIQKSEVVKQIEESIPRNLDLIKMLNKGSSNMSLEKIKENYQLSQKGMIGLYILIFILLVICALFNLYLKNTSNWLGILLLISSIKIFAIGIVVRVLPDHITWNISPPELKETQMNLIINISSKISTQLFAIAVILLILSLALFVAKRFFPKPNIVQPSLESTP